MVERFERAVSRLRVLAQAVHEIAAAPDRRIGSHVDREILVEKHRERREAGDELGCIANIDVAPTIARLLGLKLERAEGRVLTEILVE